MEINLLKYITLKRLINVIQIISSFILSRIIRKPIVWGMPISYSIEPTNYCNLKCPECPSGLGELTRPRGFLSLENFKSIVDQIKDTGFYIQLFFQGEPYINKNLPEMINYAREKNIYISISTNGHYINKKNVNHLLENSPDKIIFSIDGLDEKIYTIYRVGGSFKKADEGLRLLIEKKLELKKKYPFVELQFIVMQQNEHQVTQVFDYGNEIGVDKVTLKTMQITSTKNAEKFLPKNEKYSRYSFNENELNFKNKLLNHCFALWRTSVITWDGRIVPCCFDKDAKYEFGRLSELGFKKIWKSENYNNFRMNILKNRRGIEMCTNCTEGLKTNILEMGN